MSEYANLEIKNLCLYVFRNYIDKKIASLIFSDINLIVNNNFKYGYDEDEAPITYYAYKTKVSNAKDRLDVLGYTMNQLEKLFCDKKELLIDYDPFLYHLHKDYDDYDLLAKERYEKNISFKKWLNSLRKFINFQKEKGSYMDFEKFSCDLKINTETDKIIFYGLCDFQWEYRYSYGLKLEENQFPLILRAILECCDDEEEIILDFTNIQFWAEDCIPKALGLNDEQEKTIVLLEGTSDKEILDFSLEHLFPHLKDLIYFMDFKVKDNKRSGGASFVVNNMKCFYFAKLKQKFIALLDNDSEGYKCKNILLNDIKDWPDNYSIQCYTELELFKKYPCISPNGVIELVNIINKAVSIELYLPDRMLKNEDGDFYPIEWESRNKINVGNREEYVYQGVIVNKESIKETFYKTRNRINNSIEQFIPEEWEKMKKLLESVLFAFK